MQLAIKQVAGLTAAIAAAVTVGANLGTSPNASVYASKSGTTLQFNSFYFGTGFAAPTLASGLYTINLNVGSGANQIVQLNASSQLPAVSGVNLTNLNASNIVSGTLALTQLALANGYLYQGNGSNNPAAVAPSSIALSAWGQPTANIALGAFTFTTTLTSFSTGQLVTYDYVNSIAQGLAIKAECQCCASSNITLSGLQTIDGYTTLAGDRVLVNGQSAPAQNGIYVAASGAWSRSADAGTWADLPGAFTFVYNGTVYGKTGWACSVAPGGTLGTTAISFGQFSNAGSYTAGSGLLLTGTVFSSVVDGATIWINGSGQHAVKSSATQYQLLVSAGSGSASWGSINLASSAAVGTSILPVANGGTGAAAFTQNTLIGAITGTGLDNLTVGASTIVGRAASGNIAALSAASVKTILNLRQQVDQGSLTAGSMTLITLSQTPASAASMMLFINGDLQLYGTDYTISGTTVSATSALNVAFGGSASDGNGFASTDNVQAVYWY